MAKAYIFLANGYEEVEGLTVVDLLRRADIETVMVSITGEMFVTSSHHIITKADELFENVDFSDADILILPGGMPGTNYLKAHPGLDRLLKQFHSEGRMLAAICAAPSVLGTKGLLMGKKATCYPGVEDLLAGADYVDAPVVQDGNIITSKGLGTAIEFALTIIRNFKGEAEAVKIAKSVQYQR